MGNNLRSHILRLAVQQPDLRADLVPLLERHGGLSLRERVLVLAAEHPEARRKLVAALREGSGNTSVIQQPPIVIQQPPVIVQQEAPAPQAPPPAMPMMMPVMPMAPPAPSPAPAPAPAPTPTVVVETPGSAVPTSPVGNMFVTEMTRKGFEADLLPQMERMHAEGMPRSQVGQTILQMIGEAFQRKDTLYNILIRHQSTFQGDADYRASLESLVGAWVASTADNGG